ncbi:MAG TPA: mechanosensitive ion channel family protein [Trichocoleus sp.]
MGAVLQKVQESLLDLVGASIKTLPAIVLALIILLATRSAAKIVSRVTEKMGQQFLRSRSLQVLFAQVCRIGTWTIGVVIAAVIVFPDLGLGDIIGLLGLSSVAIGLVFQDIFKNFLAGTLLLLEEPFRLGDQVIINDCEGTVESVKLRTTRILMYTGELIEIPNSIVFTNAVKVLTANGCRRTDLSIGVDYTTSLPLAQQVFLQALDSVEGVLKQPAPEVDFVGFEANAIGVKVRYWTASTTLDVRQIQSRVVVALKEACDRNDIVIPYPIHRVYLHDHHSSSKGNPRI